MYQALTVSKIHFFKFLTFLMQRKSTVKTSSKLCDMSNMEYLKKTNSF